jgi:hypothetical protein
MGLHLIRMFYFLPKVLCNFFPNEKLHDFYPSRAHLPIGTQVFSEVYIRFIHFKILNPKPRMITHVVR